MFFFCFFFFILAKMLNSIFISHTTFDIDADRTPISIQHTTFDKLIRIGLLISIHTQTFWIDPFSK